MANDVLIVSDGIETVIYDTIEAITILEVGAQGPPGPPGAPGPGGGTQLTAIAGEAIGGNRAVILDASGTAFYASRAILAHLGRLAGITTGAAALGAVVSINNQGVMSEPGWAWTANQPVFLGTTGVLTQTPPTTGFMQVVGRALNSTTLFINPREPLAL